MVATTKDLSKWFPRNPPPTEEASSPAGKKEPSPQSWIKKKGESWTRKYMKDMFGIKVEKRSDSPIELPDGTTIHPKKGIDFFGSVPTETPWNGHLEMEVKAFTGNFALSNIKPHQVLALNEAADRGDIAVLSLVYVDRPTKQVETMWWIPWARGYPDNPEMTLRDGTPTFAWFMRELRKRAAGNFKAKSIRKEDFDLLEQWAIRKEGRKWTAVSYFWMAKVTGNYSRTLQASLL